MIAIVLIEYLIRSVPDLAAARNYYRIAIGSLHHRTAHHYPITAILFSPRLGALRIGYLADGRELLLQSDERSLHHNAIFRSSSK